MEVKTHSGSDIRRMTNEWIIGQGAEAAQLDGIRDIFEQAGGHTEWMNEIVMEAWSILLKGQVWRSRFSTREEALAALNNPFLKDLRMRAGTNRNRKARYIEQI